MTPLSEDQAFQLGVEAYIFGYPLILMEITKAITTAVSSSQGFKAPINQFAHLKAFPDASFTAVVSPNADTLYSSAWLELSAEPIVLSVPDTGGRYYLMPMLDAWTNIFASPGKRTTGTEKGNFAILPPNWTGKLPEGVQKIQSPTSMVWIIGRTQTNGKADYEAVHAIQDQYQLTPLSQWGKSYQPPTNVPIAGGIDTQTPPVEQVKNLDAASFFTRMCALMTANPPAAQDQEMVKKLAEIGLIPSENFEFQALDPVIIKGLERSISVAYEQVVKAGQTPKAEVKNNWLMTYDLGSYGTDYLHRAGVAWVGLGANVPEDAMYPLTRVDEEGHPLSGEHDYVIHFEPQEIPPVNAFWSITMYNNQQFFVDNPLNRYAIGDRDGLNFNDDGSLDIFISHESPGENKEGNWLPSPSDDFNLIMRLYAPKAPVLEKIWSPPLVKGVS